jgi:hypothetical protein
MTLTVSRLWLKCGGALLLIGMAGCPAHAPPKPETIYDFPADVGRLAKDLHDRAKLTIPSLVDDPMVIGYLVDSRQHKNLTYLPAQLHVSPGAQLNWISWDGSFALEFYPIPPQTAADNPIEGDPKSIDSTPVPSGPNLAKATVKSSGVKLGAYYHFKVTLDVQGTKYADPSCPPIIVE